MCSVTCCFLLRLFILLLSESFNLEGHIDFKIANIDRGVGLVRPKENYKFEKIPELEHMRFKDFYDKYYKSLPIISSEEALEFLD